MNRYGSSAPLNVLALVSIQALRNSSGVRIVSAVPKVLATSTTAVIATVHFVNPRSHLDYDPKQKLLRIVRSEN